ncbi:U11/U12 small nuclear ribonucleoprotein 35 kDa protein-like protein, partial [Leptotrombidium deliense]
GSDTTAHDKAIVRAINSDYKVNNRAFGNPEYVVFVARLDSLTNEDQIKDVFSKFGEIRNIRLVRDIITGHSKRYAFIEYKHRRDAARAVEKTHNMFIDGRKILVDFECERKMSGWKPRRLGGGFGGNRNSGQLRFGCKDRPFKKPIFVPHQQGSQNVNLY